ncbi:MAG: hypothetical protein CVU06_07680, partial [Bacteroidetes bacterium HGW-Bacteroidetes-22]
MLILLNGAGKKAAELIDMLFHQNTITIKPRAYRQKAREDFIKSIERHKKQRNPVNKVVIHENDF